MGEPGESQAPLSDSPVPAARLPGRRRFEGLYREGGVSHMVVELAAGGDLLCAIKAAHRAGGRIDEDQIMSWFVQVTHRGGPGNGNAAPSRLTYVPH